jgi:ribosome assembly protein RRB1
MLVFSLQMSNMHKTQKNVEKGGDEEESDSDDDDEEESKTPHLECARIKHQGCVNRIRVSI